MKRTPGCLKQHPGPEDSPLVCSTKAWKAACSETCRLLTPYEHDSTETPLSIKPCDGGKAWIRLNFQPVRQINGFTYFDEENNDVQHRAYVYWRNTGDNSYSSSVSAPLTGNAQFGYASIVGGSPQPTHASQLKVIYQGGQGALRSLRMCRTANPAPRIFSNHATHTHLCGLTT